MELNFVSDPPLRVGGGCPMRIYLKKAGTYSFLFFLVKGLLWLAVPVALSMLD